jgi:D-glycero-alpha-D-manno-heptose-7-phosphate kinase
MIVTRTPLRVTLGGGGTDLQSYYRHAGGFIFAMALDKHIHVSAHRPSFTPDVTLHGPEPERAARSAELRHELVRAALVSHGIDGGFEASSIGDIMGGTGLGSSSTFLVGLLHALHALAGRSPDAQALAEEACRLEIETLNKGIGKQDQYMAAFGGLTTLEIDPDGAVRVERHDLGAEHEDEFVSRTHIYYTGLRRDAAVILDDQNRAMQADQGAERDRATASLDAIKDLGRRIKAAWLAGDVDGWGRMLHEHWQSKKQLSAKISWPHIDQLYDHVRGEFGVTGGKVIGAGGGGFLMLFCPSQGKALEAYMAGQSMPRLRYGIDRAGSTVMRAAA